MKARTADQWKLLAVRTFDDADACEAAGLTLDAERGYARAAAAAQIALAVARPRKS